mgnify:CR=1 FL=1
MAGINFEEYSDSDLQTLIVDIYAEMDRRKAKPLADKATADVVQELQDAGKIPKPDALTNPEALPEDETDVPEWVNPGTDHASMYHQGDIIRHGGRIYRSEHTGLNSWEPGATGVYANVWRDITPDRSEDGEVNDGSQDHPLTWREGLNLTAGQFVTYNGKTYKVLQSHASQRDWTPESVPALFTQWASPETDVPEAPAVDNPEIPVEPHEPPEEAPADPEPSVPAFTAGIAVQPGDKVTYNGKTYTVVQAHTTAAHWPPDQVPSLFSPA